MKTERLNVEDALVCGKALPFALIRSLSAFSLGPVPFELPSAEELLEARFFSDAEEIRIFRDGAQLRAARLTETDNDEIVDSVFEVENPLFGERIHLRQSILYDEDGQARLSTARLFGWEGGEGNV